MDTPDTPGLRVVRGLRHGEALVGASDPAGPHLRPLLMDVYQPAAASARSLRPALVMAFGGGFHRGSRTDDVVSDPLGSNTAVASYCERFARRGLVCCSVDYRLATEDPVPGPRRWIAEPHRLDRSRVDFVRGLLGLPPSTSEELATAMDAAIDDMIAAVRWVIGNAAALHVDPARVVVGGFSAGAITALGAAYVARLPVAGVVSLSGALEDREQRYLIPSAGALPPALLLRGEHDLPELLGPNDRLAQSLALLGVPCDYRVATGFGHFYPHDAACVPTAPATGPTLTVEQSMARFFDAHLGTCLSNPSVPTEPFTAFAGPTP